MFIFREIDTTLAINLISLITLATLHGYGAAWLAVRMLFRPRKTIKFYGLTVFPQGMIPRHRLQLANAIGKAVGEELVSEETVLKELFEKGFLQNKIQSAISFHTKELLTQNYSSLIETLPENLRKTLLDSVSSLRRHIVFYVEKVLQSEETANSIEVFVERQVDEVLSQTVSDAITDETYDDILNFLERRIQSMVNEPNFEEKIKKFINKRVEDLANTKTSLKEMLTDDAISILKEKAFEQIDPVIHQLSELATEERTKKQISELIKREIHNYYEQLPFIKKMFVSRETLLREVDDLVDESLPERIEETLQGDFFAKEAKEFVSKTLENILARSPSELAGRIESDQLGRLKHQISKNLLSDLRSKEMQNSISAYLTDSLESMRPKKIGDIIYSAHPEAAKNLKKSISKGLTKVLCRQETTEIINSVLSKQIDSLIHTPIGKLSEHVSERQILKAGKSITDAIIIAAKQKLPEVIQEFDIGNVVRNKVSSYPAEKLESLVLSIAKEHLRTIELFGAFFGLVIGIGQAVQFYFFSS